MNELKIQNISKIVAKDKLLKVAQKEGISISDECKVHRIGFKITKSMYIFTYELDMLEDYCYIMKYDIELDRFVYEKMYKAISL